jgi:uncharacterized protein YacL
MTVCNAITITNSNNNNNIIIIIIIIIVCNAIAITVSLLISDLHVSSLTTCKSKSTKQVIYLALSSCFKHFYHEINPSNFRFICAVIFTHSVVSSDNRPSTGERAHVLCSTSAVHLLEWP